MNKNVSEEIIEIGDKEYTLFINRVGIVNWEKMTKLDDKSKKYDELRKNLAEEETEAEIGEETNPFELYKGVDEVMLETQIAEMTDVYAKFYWVALYTHYKFSLSQARELFDQAVEEYGIDQLAELANQMIENANKDILNKQRKNLKALKSTKTN